MYDVPCVAKLIFCYIAKNTTFREIESAFFARLKVLFSRDQKFFFREIKSAFFVRLKVLFFVRLKVLYFVRLKVLFS